MCLIAVKPRRARWARALLAQAAVNNPHGAGLAWAESGKIRVRRALAYKELARALTYAERYPALLHFRWATHGAKTIENVHPFIVAQHPGMVFAHNGVISSLPADAEISDTRLFNELVLSRLPVGFEQNKTMLENMAQMTSSRFAFLRADGYWFLAGDFHQKAGCWYSNTSYDPPKFTLETFDLGRLDYLSLMETDQPMNERTRLLSVGLR